MECARATCKRSGEPGKSPLDLKTKILIVKNYYKFEEDALKVLELLHPSSLRYMAAIEEVVYAFESTGSVVGTIYYTEEEDVLKPPPDQFEELFLKEEQSNPYHCNDCHTAMDNEQEFIIHMQNRMSDEDIEEVEMKLNESEQVQYKCEECSQWLLICHYADHSASHSQACNETDRMEQGSDADQSDGKEIAGEPEEEKGGTYLEDRQCEDDSASTSTKPESKKKKKQGRPRGPRQYDPSEVKLIKRNQRIAPCKICKNWIATLVFNEHMEEHKCPDCKKTVIDLVQHRLGACSKEHNETDRGEQGTDEAEGEEPEEEDSSTSTKQKSKKRRGCPRGQRGPKQYDPSEVRLTEGNKRIVQCKICDKWIATVVYNKHLKDHKEGKLIVSRACSVSEPDWFFCEPCRKQFDSKQRLQQHFHRCHREEKEENVCEVCHKKFTKKAYLQMHMRYHIPDDQVVFKECPECPLKFRLTKDFNRHVKITHSENRPFICEFCGLAFKTQQFLNKHKSVRHSSDRKRFPCSHCDKTFASSGFRRVHERSHGSERPYKCPHCPKSYTGPATLNCHIKTHANQKVYKLTCFVCGNLFKAETYLKAHLEKHGVTEENIEEMKEKAKLEGDYKWESSV